MPKIQDMIDSLGKVIKRIPTEIYGEIQKDLKFWGKNGLKKWEKWEN